MAHRYLQLAAQDRRNLSDFATRLESHLDQVLSEVAAALRDAEELEGLVGRGDLASLLRPSLSAYVGALQGDQIDHYFQSLGETVKRRAEEGVSYETVVVAIMALEVALAQRIRETYADDEAAAPAVRSSLLRFNQLCLMTIARAYLAGKEDTILAQQDSMLALSTPVVEVWDGILALPLVGTIDTARAKQVTQNLLRAIRTTQARIVIIDITGVPLVDTKVANHLIKTVRAARLLGARGIVVGISPEIADTLIALDVDFSGIDTYFSLRQGLESAVKTLGYALVPTEVR